MAGANRRLIGWGVAAVLVAGIYALPTRSTDEMAARKYPNRIPVRFWHMWSAEWKAVVDKIVDRYNKSQDKYEVIALSVPGSAADTKFLLGSIGGSPPDVMAQWNPVIPTWAQEGVITPFDDLMSPQEKATFDHDAYPVVKAVGAYKGKIYGIAIGINLMEIYYLPQQFREAGLDPDKFPTTLEGLVADGQKLDRRDANGHLTHLGFLPGSYQQMTPYFGGGFYDPSRDKLTLDTQQNLEALSFLAAERKRLGFDEVTRFQAGLNTQSAAGGWPFITGAYSAVVDGQWRVEQLAKYAPKLVYRTAPIPAPVGGVAGSGYGNGNFMVIPRSAKEKAGAWDFVKFWSGITHPERAAEFYTMGGWLPLSDKVANAPIYQAYIKKYPQFKTFVDAVRSPKIQVAPPVPYQVFVNDQVQKAEDFALRGTLTPQAALAGLQSAVDEEVKRRKEMGLDE